MKSVMLFECSFFAPEVSGAKLLINVLSILLFLKTKTNKNDIKTRYLYYI
jgi:hypothetical protein